MKDVMLKIIGTQQNGDTTEDNMEFVTEGRLCEKNGTIYLIYDESELSGFPGCTTSLRLRGDTIRLKRIGKDNSYNLEMEFKKGKRFFNSYPTPYGDINMEVLTEKITNNLSENGFGDIDIDYHISLDGLTEGRNTLRIKVEETNKNPD